MLVAGLGTDCLVNTFWFLLGVIPGHVHGFYITCTYFHRRAKVRKGRWPGGPKAFVYSPRVTNGGARDERVRQLWRAEQRAKDEKLARRRGSRRSSWGGGLLSPQSSGVGSRRG